MGLGKYIVDGGTALRVCPYHPNQVLQMSEMDIALRDTQTNFIALETNIPTDSSGNRQKTQFQVDDGFNLVKVSVRDAEHDGSLQWICSTYDPMDQCIYDGFYEGRNRKLISFAGILQNGVWPMPELLRLVLKLGQEEMQRPVEIEFACNIHPDKSGEFYLLQIRPMVDNRMNLDEDLTNITDEQCLLRNHNAIGHGVTDDVCDVVYVKTDNFSAANNTLIADEINRINQQFLKEKRHYILVGPGRWGSSDSWLGIPVKWPHISAAKAIVEAGLDNYRIDPSQGTHFFQNLTSFGVAYFTVNDFIGEGIYDQAYLNSLPAVAETQFVRHVRLPRPAVIKVDGMKKVGVILKPELEG
jgi:hypothetical protein